MVFPGHTRLLFYVSAIESVKQSCLEKSVTKLVMIPFHALPFPHRAAVVIVAVTGRTHLLFKLTFSMEFLKVVLQEQQNYL